MNSFISLLKLYLLVALISCDGSKAPEDNTVNKDKIDSEKTDDTESEEQDDLNRTDLKEWGEAKFKAGSKEIISDIFQMIETKLVEVEDNTEGETHCEDALNTGHVYKYKAPEDSYHYVSCLGKKLDEKKLSDHSSQYKAFKTTPDFFRQFSGFVHLTRESKDEVSVSCYRIPEKTFHEEKMQDKGTLTNVCSDIFAFAISVPDTEKLSEVVFEFNSGSSAGVTILGEFK